MIVKERTPKVATSKTSPSRIEEVMTDGRMTEHNTELVYRVRELALYMKRVGRQLTAAELEEFVLP